MVVAPRGFVEIVLICSKGNMSQWPIVRIVYGVDRSVRVVGGRGVCVTKLWCGRTGVTRSSITTCRTGSTRTSRRAGTPRRAGASCGARTSRRTRHTIATE